MDSFVCGSIQTYQGPLPCNKLLPPSLQILTRLTIAVSRCKLLEDKDGLLWLNKYTLMSLECLRPLPPS